nr:MAG TPA: hypothetical protein [Caudoviricetes sp.]
MVHIDITIDCNSRGTDRSNQRDRVNRLCGRLLTIGYVAVLVSLGCCCGWGLVDNSFPLLVLATPLKYFSTLKN